MSVTSHGMQNALALKSRDVQAFGDKINSLVFAARVFRMPAFIYQKDNFAEGVRFAVGQSDFETLIESNACLVDKTEVIQEIIDSTDTIILFPRPRRFGKTLLMRMLKTFFEKTEYSKRPLFEPLNIWRAGEKYHAHQGRYPVIYLSLKDIKEPTFALAYEKFEALLAEVYRYHHEKILPTLDEAEHRTFMEVFNKNASKADLENSLLNLSRWLERAYQQKVVILLDEYDSPIHVAYTEGYYSEMTQFMRNLMGAAFKDNVHVYRGVITGILRIAKESLFSDLNNLKVYSVLSKRYGEYFGFTQEELDLLLEKSKLTEHQALIREWYNGYQFGEFEIYNPWSIINCLDGDCDIKPHWVNTAQNTLLQDMLAKADADTKANLEKLLRNELIEVPISEGIIFNTLNLDASALYSFLLFTGYLKAKNVHVSEDSVLLAELSIPNREIAWVYRDLFKHWVTAKIDISSYHDLLKSLTEGHIDEFERLLRYYVETSMSYFDADKKPEKFYHGFILGILVGLQQTHEVRSNRESGYGRADILVIPKDHSKLGVVLEFKRSDSAEALPQDAENALAQIEKRAYVKDLHAQGIKEVLTIGVAFHGKQIALKSQS